MLLKAFALLARVFILIDHLRIAHLSNEGIDVKQGDKKEFLYRLAKKHFVMNRHNK